MRTFHRASAFLGIIVELLCGVAVSHAQVNGNVTISATDPVFGTISVSTSSQFAGAVSSLKWNNKEFINNWDHGRQLQVNAQFFSRFECYNPYEAGSFDDARSAHTSSVLLSLSANGNKLDSTTQMAWYLDRRDSPTDYCGNPANWLPCPPYTGPLSGYQVHKTITIGYGNLPNVIEYLSELYLPEIVQKGLNQVIAVMPYDFSSVRTYNIVSKDYRKIHSLAGEDDSVKVVSTADGSYAMGFYSPEMLQPYGNGTANANWWHVVPPDPLFPDPTDPSRPDPDFACVHVGSFNRYDSFNGPGFTYDRAYLVIGNLDQVKSTLANLHIQFGALDPDVFDWREYVAMNQLQAFFPTQAAAENHWITHGIAEGRNASLTFSPSQYLQLNPDLGFGATDYQAVINHYITIGRAEGRSTLAKPAAGMQHLSVFTHRTVSAAGQNAFSQLATSSPTTGPNHISALDNSVTEIAAGDYTSFAVKNDGTLWAWGSNQYGARGDGSSGDNLTSPVQVPMPALITTPSRRGKHAVAVGTGVYAAIDTNGQVWTWGVNWNGRLGDGTTASRFTPARVRKSATPNDYLSGIVSIAAGGGTVAAIDADGNVWTWGAGANGALGNGFTNDSVYPVQVLQGSSNNTTLPLVGIDEVACGSSGFCIALARYGAVFGWGNNAFSQLALPAGGALAIATPIPIGSGNPIDAIAAGSAHCLAHSSDGNVYGWGYNGRGQLGIGSIGVAQSPPVAMNAGPNGMNDISDVIAGANYSVMIRNSDRAVFVTGDNQSGQLGIPGNQLTQSLPVRSSF